MAKVIVFTRPGGAISVVNMAPQHIQDVFDGDEDSAIAAERAKPSVVPSDATDVTVIDEGQIPTDRWFRNAWMQSGSTVSVDLLKARKIQASHIAHALGLEIAKLKLSEQQARLEGKPNNATADKATRTALEVLDVDTLATQIANVGNANALKAIWPAQVPKP